MIENLSSLKIGDKVRVVACLTCQMNARIGDILTIRRPVSCHTECVVASNDRAPEDFNYLWNANELEFVRRPAHDCRGVEINPGDDIVYPGRHGSSLWMNVARVKEITKDGKVITGKGRRIDRMDRVAVVGRRVCQVR